MLVHIHSNYDYPRLLRQTPDQAGKWEGIQFTYDAVERCDYLVVINHPTKDIRIQCRKGGKILLIQEPPFPRNDYLKAYFPFFDKIICGFHPSLSSNICNTQAALPWLIDRTYDQLLHLKFTETEKKDSVSWVTSNSNVNPGHEPRLKFLELLEKSDLNVAVFGKGIQPLADKFDGIYPYRYTLAIENYAGENYWTEKIADAFLSYTMPIYYGCKNMEDFFPKGSFVKIDIHQPEEAIAIIKDAVAGKLWEKNKQALEEARQLILKTYQFFPAISKLIHTMNCEPSYQQNVIPVNPASPNRLIKRLKNLFH